MTTFIFMLTKDDGAATVERVIMELAASFPQHGFIAVDADIGGYESSIFAMHGSAGSGDEPGIPTLPKEAEVSRQSSRRSGRSLKT